MEGRPRFIQDQRRTVGVPTPNYTRPTFYRVGCRCEGYLTSLHGTTKYYTEEHMASNEEHSTFPYYEQSNSTRERKVNMNLEHYKKNYNKRKQEVDNPSFNVASFVKPTLELLSLFATPIVKTNLGREFTKDELQFLTTDIPMSTEHGVRVLNHHQSQSFQIFEDFAEKMKDIKTFCEFEIKRYMEDIEGVDTAVSPLGITASWLNKLEPEAHHPLHNHKNSYLSGLLYIRCLPDDSINFTSLTHSRKLTLPITKHTPFNTEGAKVNIKEGDFIMFPSHVLHEVARNETEDQERISLSFDTWPTCVPSLYPPFGRWSSSKLDPVSEEDIELEKKRPRNIG